MELWEWLLNEDRRLNLADPDRVILWLDKAPWWPKEPGKECRPVSGFESESVRAAWTRNMLCLRSLARKLKRKPVRTKAIPSSAEALDVLHRYIGMLQVQATPHAQPTELVIVSPVHIKYARVQRLPPERIVYPEAFWVTVFRSFVQGNGQVCGRCGKLTGTTPTGRRRRQRLCKDCRWLKWREKQPAKKMQEKWRTDKKKQKQTQEQQQ
jgi:hypothetical protein